MRLVQLDNPAARWSEFFDAHGPDAMKASYGWTAPKTEARSGETVYEFWTDYNCWANCDCVGWGSLTKNPLNQEFWLALGLFPECTNKGYGKNFKTLLVEQAFEKHNAETVTSHVLDTNTKYQDHIMRTIKMPWRYSGHVWFPAPSYKVFSVTYDDWNAHKCLTL